MKKIILSLLLATACLSNVNAQNENVVSLTKSYNLLKIEQTSSINLIAEDINAIVKANNINKNSVLIVFDLDNTLIKSDQELGSDLWYNWQTDTTSKYKLNKDCLYDVAVPYLTNTNTYSPVEKSTVGYFINLRDKYNTIALTSRSPELRESTEKSLQNIGIKFNNTLFSDSIIKIINNEPKTNYSNGIFMTTGGDKGDLLIKLLGEDIHKYEFIFFIDDGKKNIDNMTVAFANKNLSHKLKSYWYTKVEDDWNKEYPKQTYAEIQGQFLSRSWDKIKSEKLTSQDYEKCDCSHKN